MGRKTLQNATPAYEPGRGECATKVLEKGLDTGQLDQLVEIQVYDEINLDPQTIVDSVSI